MRTPKPCISAVPTLRNETRSGPFLWLNSPAAIADSPSHVLGSQGDVDFLVAVALQWQIGLATEATGGQPFLHFICKALGPTPGVGGDLGDQWRFDNRATQFGRGMFRFPKEVYSHSMVGMNLSLGAVQPASWLFVMLFAAGRFLQPFFELASAGQLHYLTLVRHGGGVMLLQDGVVKEELASNDAKHLQKLSKLSPLGSSIRRSTQKPLAIRKTRCIATVAGPGY